MIKAFQWDLARQAERLDWLLAQKSGNDEFLSSQANAVIWQE